MPVHARDRKEAGGPQGREEMELEFGEPDGSSGSEEEEDEEDESPGSSGSDGGESEEMDDEDCERRRMECLNEMSNLEKQFTDLKDQNEPLTQSALVGGHHRRQSSRTLWTNGDRRKRERLYKERLNQVDYKLQEVSSGKGPEYLEPLATLQDNMQIRTKVAGIYRELCLESVKNKYDCEIQAARQHCESEKLLLFDTVQSELEEKIRRLEEDRHSIDITSELWNDEIQSRKKRKDPFSPDKKKRPMVVSGPYIVYMLQDLDILEDWTSIRKAMATLGPHRVKPEDLVEASLRSPGASPRHGSGRGLAVSVVPVKMDKLPHSARSEEGRLHYDGEWYGRGHAICIDKKDEYPTSAIITTIHHDEVWFKRQDGSKSKLYISQLQKGKYTIKHM